MASEAAVRRRLIPAKVRNKKVLLSLNEEEFEMLDEAARAQGLANATLARVVLTDWLERRERGEPDS
ncbi:MAG TPA: hypothetical protein VF173_32180 [Thermoanaerobaculia bacterium]|nr:hypothetical protein [Thermoanaerobaculia bacterium]